jgi:salicylate hydroxylase
MMVQRSIAIVGAGIGGLTAAVALARMDVRCVVYERAAGPPAGGAGIQISPNAAAELHALGLSAAFENADRPACREIRRWRDNTVLGRTDLGRVAERRYGTPYYTVRRGALVRSLLGAVHRLQGPAAVRFGRRCTDIWDDGSRVVLEFDGGPVAYADAVVGADGLRSVVRRRFRDDPPRYSGHVAARAVVPMAAARPLVDPDRIVVWLGPGRHCVAYPIDRGDQLNLVFTTPSADPPPASSVSGQQLIAEYRGWHAAVVGLLRVAGTLDQRALYDRPAMPSWHHGRAVLIGDAAHPMLPFTAQGAAQAVEDAAMLARFVHRPDWPAGYEAARRSRVRKVAAAAHGGLRGHHLPDGAEQRRRDRMIAAAPSDALDWLYGRRPVTAAAGSRRSERNSPPPAGAATTPARPGTPGRASGRSA